MSKLTTCKSCGKEVSKSAKKCPHCGEKLKMGLFLKLIIAGIAIAVIGAITAPSQEEFRQTLLDMKSAQSSSVSSSELAPLFSMGSKGTDLQRDKKEKEIKGQLVEWTIPVYEVKVLSAKEGKYKIQGSSKRGAVGTFVTIYALDDNDKARIESLKTGDLVKVKGKITGTFMRNIEIEPAVLM